MQGVGRLTGSSNFHQEPFKTKFNVDVNILVTLQGVGGVSDWFMLHQTFIKIYIFNGNTNVLQGVGRVENGRLGKPRESRSVEEGFSCFSIICKLFLPKIVTLDETNENSKPRRFQLLQHNNMQHCFITRETGALPTVKLLKLANLVQHLWKKVSVASVEYATVQPSIYTNMIMAHCICTIIIKLN